ncbi:catechol 2,3-dioxygenase [Fusibacter ferrireducens]|uniref:Metapyrocatechase n=1 Tax=Fusibacter ferrireducens TaxID=2785058 RepID=A0ABR9ZSP8_9FIRM|nr:catechol 2,3-dioxygenase [Fusibacter ferrireducens]MBF4693491.1 catechol 2,3-dioxygenase [Fusibacter ferrireducens]
MALKGVLRTGLVQLRVLDLDKSLDHYRKHIGLTEVGRTEDGRVMLKGNDEFDHHSVVLRLAETPGLDYIGLKVDTKENLERFEAETKAFGFEIEEIAPNSDQPGFGRRIAVKLPTGHRIDLYSEVELAEKHPGIKNPKLWIEEPKGMDVSCFDHALLYGPNAKEATQWFVEVLEMSIVEVVKKEDGVENLAVWLSASNRGHDLAILDYDKPGKLHHISFHLEDWNAIGHAADIMGQYNISIDVGPTRHGVTRGQTIYFFDPSGNRNEVFCGGYFYYPDMPLRVWDIEHVGEGIFYYDKVLNERFLSVVS